MSEHNVYMYGVIAASKMCKLDERFRFPEPNGYAEVKQVVDTVSGETGGGSIVLARLGVRVKVDGNWLDAQSGPRLQAILQSHGIDTSRLVIKQDYTAAWEIVFADDRTRTPFGRYVDLFSTHQQWSDPRPEDVEAADMVAIDPFFPNTSEQLGLICGRLGVPYVTIDCAPDSALCRDAAAVIVSEDYLTRQVGRTDLERALCEYRSSCGGLVVFTFGEDQVVHGRRGGRVGRCQPFDVEVVDTTGAGDAFRSGVIYGLLQGWEDERVVEFACAVAGLVCASFPAATQAPTAAQAEELVASRRRPTSPP